MARSSVVEDPKKDRFEKRLSALAEKTNPNTKVVRRVQNDGLIVDVVKPMRQWNFMSF